MRFLTLYDPNLVELIFIYSIMNCFFLKTSETLEKSSFYVTCTCNKGFYRRTGVAKLLAVTRTISM